jgi:hypothetical protein
MINNRAFSQSRASHVREVNFKENNQIKAVEPIKKLSAISLGPSRCLLEELSRPKKASHPDVRSRPRRPGKELAMIRRRRRELG